MRSKELLAMQQNRITKTKNKQRQEKKMSLTSEKSKTDLKTLEHLINNAIKKIGGRKEK